MPLILPNKNEIEKEFVNRCMGNPTMNRDFPDNTQRAAVCHSQWRKVHGGAAPRESKRPTTEDGTIREI